DHVVPVSSARAAELTKVFENTFRAVNIALVNEMMLLCDRMGLNVWEVLEASNSKPFGIMKFLPGPGVGGHCIPLDPHYLEWKAREYNFRTRFIGLAGEINRAMPQFVVNKAARVLNEFSKSMKGSRILVLGVAYKNDIDDWRESPAIDVLKLLDPTGADVAYSDPFVPDFDDHGYARTGVEMTDAELEKADLVIITTAHKSVDYQRVVDKAKAVLDTRNATHGLKNTEGKVTLL
ncbi:MAG: nucleotide sugar dehydrogenase, partial [bacterium]